MKNKILILVGIIILGFILVRYFTALEDAYYKDGNEGIVVIPEDGPTPDRVTIEQAWDQKTREAFWYTSQGSEIMPYSWFTWLEQADNSELFRNSKFMESLGYLPQKSSESNPSGLPIGFSITRARENKERGFGLTCAACHTNQIDYQGSNILVEGAPTLANFVGFYSEIVKSLAKTNQDDQKFERFAKKILADNYNLEAAKDLRTEVRNLAITTAEREKVNALPHDYPADFTSYGRLDAFGNIMNAGSAFGLNNLSNKNFPTAPVSYPFLWGTHQSDVVQWNASAKNTPIIGPLVRNVGEVVGVFGGLEIEPASWWQQILGREVSYSSTVDFKGLGELETFVKDLRSPQWPENILPQIDITKASQGSIIFAEKCQSCHQVMSRVQEGEHYISNKTLVSKLGTDPLTAWNIQNYKAKTLILEGTREAVIKGDTFGLSTAAIGIPVNGVTGLVLKRPIKALEAGLAPGEHEGIEISQETLKSHLEKLLYANSKITASRTDNVSNIRIPKALGPNATPMDLDKLVYKGRPLNGIWATAPYMHNGSVPNLHQLLMKPEDRVKEFHVGSRQFDAINVGFATDSGPSVFHVMNDQNNIIPGNSNLGHAYGTGLSDDEKWNLIEYMKTL